MSLKHRLSNCRNCIASCCVFAVHCQSLTQAAAHGISKTCRFNHTVKACAVKRCWLENPQRLSWGLPILTGSGQPNCWYSSQDAQIRRRYGGDDSAVEPGGVAGFWLEDLRGSSWVLPILSLG